MADDIQKITEALGGMTEQVKLLHESLNKAAKSTELQSETLKKFRITSEGVKTQFDNLKLAAEAVAKGTDKSTANFKRLAAEYRDSAEKARNLNEKTERLMKLYASGNPIITRLTQTVGLLKSGWTALAATMGLTGVSFGNLVGKVTEYNKAIFEVSRNSQVLGGGIKSLESAYKSLGSSTSYSQKEFADLTQTFQNAYVGAGKSAESISKMASSLERAFGPDMNAKKEALNSLLGVMNKFPALYDQIESVMNLAQSGGGVDQVAGMSAQMILIGRAAGMTANEFKTMGQAMMKPTAEQEKQIKLNRQMAEMTARWNNLILQAGQLMLPFLEGLMKVLNGVGRVADGMGKWPAAITLATVAFAGLKTGAMAFDYVIGNVLKNLGKMALAKMGIGAAGKAAGGVVDAVTSGAPKLSLAKDAPAVLAREAASKGGLLSRGIGAFKASPRLMGMAKGGIASAAGVVMEMGGDYLKTSKNKTVKEIGKGTSALGTTAKYAGIGAMVGSAIPVIGTAAGAVIGGLIGAYKGINREYDIMGDKAKSQNEELAEIEGRYGEIEDRTAQVNEEEEEKLRTLFKQNAEFMKQQMNLQAIKAMSDGIVSANHQLLDTMTSMGIVSPELIKEKSIENLKALQEQMKQINKQANSRYLVGGADDTQIKDMLGGAGVKDIKQSIGVEIDAEMNEQELAAFEKELSRRMKEKAASKDGLTIAIAVDGKNVQMGLDEAKAKVETSLADIKENMKTLSLGNINAEGGLNADMLEKLEKYKTEKKDKEDKKEDFKEIEKFEKLLSLQDQLTAKKAEAAQIDERGNALLGRGLISSQQQAVAAENRKKQLEETSNALTKSARDTQKVSEIAKARIKIEAEVAQAAGAGAGTSMKYRQQLLEVGANQQQENKKAIADLDKELSKKASSLGLSEKQLEAYKEAITPQQRTAILNEKFKNDTTAIANAEMELSFLTQDRTQLITEQGNVTKEMYELSKDMREGYMQAIGEMAVGAGDFAAILGSQAKGADQLNDAIDANTTTGIRGLGNSLLVGGRSTEEVRTKGSRSTPQAVYREDGSISYRSEAASKINQAEVSFPMTQTGKNPNRPLRAGTASGVSGSMEAMMAIGANIVGENSGMQPVTTGVGNARKTNDTIFTGGQIGVEQVARNAPQSKSNISPVPPNTNLPSVLTPAPSINTAPVPPPALPSRVNDTSSASKMPVTEIIVKLGPGLETDFKNIKEGIAAITAMSGPSALT